MNNPDIFYQEGWHYELNDVNEEPIYKGVVFNEMKGAFSSADGVRSRYMMQSLFPDSCYGKESGGDPEYITDLTHEQFCAAHRRHYNPSNAYIFLDGDMDIEEILGIIDEEYLSHYGKEGEYIAIERQPAVQSETVVKEFEISPQMDPQGKAQVAYGYVIGSFDDYEKTVAFSLISSVLCGSNESPLKKAILSQGLGEDISFDVQDGILQPFVEIDVINTDLEKEETIHNVITQELQRVVREGLDRKELEATLNQREFKARERDFGGAPKGLVFAVTALDSWLYGGDPLSSLCFDKLFESLRNRIGTSFYEDLIEEYLLNSKHCAKVLLKPSNTLGQLKAQHEKEKLQAIAETWTAQDREKLVEMNRKLQAWQAESDTPEQKATLPALHLEDLNEVPTDHPLTADKQGDTLILKHEEETNGISYVTLYVKADDLELRDYTCLTQMLTLFGKLRTAKHDPLTLNRDMRGILGDFSASFSPTIHYHSHEQNSYVTISWSSLLRNDMEAAELIKEILYTTDFSDRQAIRDVLKQNLFALEQTFINAGQALAVQRAAAYSSPLAVLSEYAGGYEAYRYLKDLDENWEDKAEDFLAKLRQLQQKLFIKERYMLSVTSQDKEAIVEDVLKDAPSGETGEASLKQPLGHRREGIAVPANISYAAKSALLSEDVRNMGVMYLISNILTYDYLWNNIRVKGGAYGCGFRCGLSKAASFYSYRDPSPANSLRIYEEVTDYLKDFCDHTESIENYIVGTTGDYDPLLSTKASIRTSDLEYIMGVSYEDKKAIYRQILQADKEEIRKAIALFEKINRQDDVCVIGNREAIEKCGNRLDVVFDLNEKRNG